ncbi:MAG: PorV/PorQ family protein [Candidatus Hydrogenedentota bacterium]
MKDSKIKRFKLLPVSHFVSDISYFSLFTFLMILLTSYFLLLTFSLYAGSGDEGKASAVFLKLDPSAQTAGFGSAYVARTDNVNSIYFNPAGLGFIDYYHGLFTYNDIFADIDYNYVAFAMPLKQGRWGGLGIGVTLLDYGSMTRTQLNDNQPVTGLGTFSADDLAVALSYGRKVMNEDLSLGITAKYVKEEIYTYDDNTFAVDLGLRWKTDVEGLTVGLTYRNIGGDLRFVREDDPLPRAFVGGFYYTKSFVQGRHKFGLAADVVAPNDGGTYAEVGGEYIFNDLFALRVGYNGQQEADAGLTLGGGFNFQNLSIDYAFVPYDELGDQHRVSLSLIFGYVSPKK